MSINCPVYGPEGTNPPTNGDRASNIWRCTSGSTMQLDMKLTLPDGTPVTPDNSMLRFVLADNQFCYDVIWEAAWYRGITAIPGTAGVVRVKLPDNVAASLRRGSYKWAMYVQDQYGNDQQVAQQGSMLVEYTVGGPQHNIPYKDTVI